MAQLGLFWPPGLVALLRGLNAEEEVDTNLMGVLGNGVVGPPTVPAAFLAASEG